MANYRNTEKITFSQQEEKRFRQLFNQWAASVEGYNRNKLGDELKIVQETGHIWLSMLTFGQSLQPVLLSAEKPEPYCGQ